MNHADPSTLADLVLVAHALVVLFVASGPPLILVGVRRGWRWVRAPLYRWSHLAAILFVTAQAWLGQLCPLTLIEAELRAEAGADLRARGFVAHWLERMLYFDAPLWWFAAAYTAFAALVVWLWWRYPPRRTWRSTG